MEVTGWGGLPGVVRAQLTEAALEGCLLLCSWTACHEERKAQEGGAGWEGEGEGEECRLKWGRTNVEAHSWGLRDS